MRGILPSISIKRGGATMQLIGNTISFNGINSSRYGLYLCSVGGDEERSFGLSRSIDAEDGGIKSITSNTKTLEIQLVKLGGQFYDPEPLTEEELEEISHWLFSSEEYKPLMVDNQSKVYYGVFVDGSIWQNGARHGYLTLQFQLDSGHGYSVLQNTDVRVNGTRTVTLHSKHTVGKYNEIDIEIKLADNETDLTIENLTTGQKMVLQNVPQECRHIRIYNDKLKHIANMDNASQNLRPYFNKEFIHLSYGKNKIKVTGVGQVRFISQAKITFI